MFVVGPIVVLLKVSGFRSPFSPLLCFTAVLRLLVFCLFFLLRFLCDEVEIHTRTEHTFVIWNYTRIEDEVSIE